MSQINRIVAGRYELTKLIGQGGMADVYLAQDVILNRVVAVKLMRSSLTGDPVYITRFHREASAVASLSHKNIVEIYDVGQENDDYYIVMEYVPGQTLKELIHKRGALHYVEAVDIMKQVASATAKAHSMGIIHRDLKPQNIMVTDSGVVKIGDFGIASIQSLSQVTQTDTIMGSLHYLAPEIARGEKATPQSDIYALGIVFYELLKGEVPFNGESPVNIALKHMRDELPSVREFNQFIPQSIENIIIKATAKNVKDRYLTVDEMLEDLSTCLLRENEEKLVFTHVETSEEKTIVADDKAFFTQTTQPIVQVEEEEEIPFYKKKNFIIMISSLLIAAALFLTIFFIFLKPSNTFSMPNVTSFTQENAISHLENKGLKVDQNNIIYEVSDSDEGLVISTDPISGTAVRKGDKVTLTVSSGKFIIIENFVGQTFESVEAKLITLGFTVTKIEESSDQTEGSIIAQSLSEGTKVEPNSASKRITLTVSKGYKQIVPNVYGQNIDRAKAILEESGFVVILSVLPAPTSEDVINSMKINVVINQSLEAFSEVTRKGETITLEYYDHIPVITPPVDENNQTDNPDVAG